MPGTFSKLSYDALDVASGAKGITVNGRLVDRFGARPHWRKDGSILWTANNSKEAPDFDPDGPLDGQIMRWDGSRADVFAAAGYEGWSCHNGIFAAWRTTDRLKGITVSESGYKAGIVDLGGSGILEVNGFEVDRGAIYEARFTRDVLVWTKNVNGVMRTFGRLTPTSATDPISVLPDDEFWPVALVTQEHGVWVLNHGHRHCFVRPWGEVMGHIVRVGVADRPDWGQRPDGLARVVYSDRGVLHDHALNLDSPRVNVRVPVIPEPDEDEMNPPGVTIDRYGPVIGPTGTWSVEWHDRNDPRYSGKVEIVNGSVHVTLTNPEGTDRSGNRRPVEVRGA